MNMHCFCIHRTNDGRPMCCRCGATDAYAGELCVFKRPIFRCEAPELGKAVGAVDPHVGITTGGPRAGKDS